MRRLPIALLALVLSAAAARAEVLRIEIDLSDQQMTVRQGAEVLHVWPVSTARAGKVTPVGEFTPLRLERMHYSRLYHRAPMPWSIFFRGNYAIHGTTETDHLGAPASAGCVRLAPEAAEVLFAEVKAAGLAETLIVIAE